jgi:leucyl/phenylalanyl-tRNA---protein transferase
MIHYIAKGIKEFPTKRVRPIMDVVAVSEELCPELILSGYKQAAFPWYEDNELFYWYSPDPRCIIYPEKLHTSRSMQKFLRSTSLQFIAQAPFRNVMQECATIKRKPTVSNGILYANDSTWINDSFYDAYCSLADQGNAIAFAAFDDGQLVGGMYGVLDSEVFYGESMFSHRTNASKFVMINAAQWLLHGGIKLIDCQMQTEHLVSMGAEMCSLKHYRQLLSRYTAPLE